MAKYEEALNWLQKAKPTSIYVYHSGYLVVDRKKEDGETNDLSEEAKDLSKTAALLLWASHEKLAYLTQVREGDYRYIYRAHRSSRLNDAHLAVPLATLLDEYGAG